MSWDKVNRHQWAKTRQLVLIRDNHRCQIRLPGCKGDATQVDHIKPISQGGMFYDPNNCRAACQSCNLKRGTPMPTPHTPPENW